MLLTCPCVSTSPRNGELAPHFSEVRLRCPALLKVLLPEEAWKALVAAEQQQADAARHASSILLAFASGHLSRMTAPVHRFLLDGVEIRHDLTAQYRQDLQECWLLGQDVVRRHERARSFFGRICELQLADWLAEQTWRISGLEALGGNHDIVAESSTGEVCSFEVKYIGWQTGEFLRVVDVLAGGDDGGAMPLWQGVPAHFFTAANYLLRRVYEAGRPLRHRAGTRIAAIVIDDLSWRGFATPLEDRWIDWTRPAFLGPPVEWAHFLQEDPQLGTDLGAVISALNQLWVFRFSEYQCVLALQVPLP